MSGDLRDPQRSIPRGTVISVAIGFLVYISVPILLSFTCDPAELRENSLIWLKVALVPLLILPGLMGAIFSSAVGSILGAPRTLQALSGDGVLPKLFLRIPLPTGESAVAILLSAGIALAAVLLGDLNAVAPFVTMFFLTTYGMINLVAGLEKLIGDPSYRPSMNVPWLVTLAGAASCFFVMFLINRTACLMAVTVEIGGLGVAPAAEAPRHLGGYAARILAVSRSIGPLLRTPPARGSPKLEASHPSLLGATRRGAAACCGSPPGSTRTGAS